MRLHLLHVHERHARVLLLLLIYLAQFDIARPTLGRAYLFGKSVGRRFENRPRLLLNHHRRSHLEYAVLFEPEGPHLHALHGHDLYHAKGEHGREDAEQE